MTAASRVPPGAERHIRFGGHLLFAVLMATGLARTILHGGPVLASVLGAAAVTACYLYGAIVISVRGTDIAVMWTLVLVAGWIALTVVSPDFVWLAFVLAMLVWHFLPAHVAIPAEVVIAATAMVASLRTDPAGIGAVIGPIIGIGTAIAVTEAVHRVIDAAATREALARELVRTQLRLAEQEREASVLAERERIGGEIHDGAGQALAGIVMLLQSATDPVNPPGQRAAQAETALAMATAALAQTRTMLQRLDAPVAPDALVDGLRAAAEHAGRLGLPAQWHVHGDAGVLDADTRTVLLRAAQEALANAARHSGAHRAVVTLTVLDHAAHLDVVDDGRGFQPALADGGTGFGLAALGAHVERRGGAFAVDSEPGEGTTVHVQLPIGAAE
ncbi:ATP-binding protein [Gordonia sp. (in: high G+C Gram-positive bacteria)]|uniref:sensor histidine kinase n=1 Tax=Gordonia sp. (in: high G+C Gram-positive bacteria) TaxID=84139 RepID=UPI0026042FD1|nr:ATP-binding protein [Gordonia sp. (in: high G+C Gram-positive bacteria)]